MSSPFAAASTTCLFAYFYIYRAKENHLGIGCGRHSVVSKDALAIIHDLVAHRHAQEDLRESSLLSSEMSSAPDPPLQTCAEKVLRVTMSEA
ncbi:hypothetical protein E4U32_007605 [Claviceps aff. humidiphila group G2b]|nr:hypothetical protein E4U32_007605 [Claviceps aff. humidiphila group G2b]